MDLLTAVEQIVEKAQGAGLSSEFYRKAARPIKYVAEKMDLTRVAKTEHSHPLGMVVSTHFRCGKWVKRGLKNGALPFNID